MFPPTKNKEPSQPQPFAKPKEEIPFFTPNPTQQIQREPNPALSDPLNIAEGYDEQTIASMVIDQATKHVRLITMGGKDYDGFALVFSGLSDGSYFIDRNYGPDPTRFWDIFNADGSKNFGGLKFDVDFPSVDFNSLKFQKRMPLAVVSNQLPAFQDKIPMEGNYQTLKHDLAYIDNFTTASYDVFRKEIHLIFEDGNEVVIPISGIDLATSPPPISDKLQKKLDDLEASGELTLPKSNIEGNGKYGTVTARKEDKFYEATNQGIVRPETLHKTVTPRLHQAIKDLDPGTQDLLFQAAVAFMAGPPMPEGSEYVILIPLLTKGGMGLKQAIARASERKALEQVAEKEAGTLGKNMPKAQVPHVSTGNVRSMGELIEPSVIAHFAPNGKQLPPKFKAFDWYEGGTEAVANVGGKLKGKPITVKETTVKGGKWTSLHTILTKEKTTTVNVTKAVNGKLSDIFDALHNSSGRVAARDPNPIAPDTYSRVMREGTPDKVVVHIHLHDAPVTAELEAAAKKAYQDFASKGDLPPVEIIVTGTNTTHD